MQDLIAINVVIGDRTYRIKIRPADEEALRAALRTINDQILEYKTQFAGKDMQDYVAMVLLWFATQHSGTSLNAQEDSALSSALQKMEELMDKAL
jgi:hypothetical protein